MNNDIISRKALKNTLNEIFDTVNVVAFDDIIAVIDNAPTPWHPFTEEPSAFRNAKLEVLAEEDRPHGEWNITDAYPHIVYCNKCFKTYAQENWEVWKEGSLPRNFCPNCGADMRKETENETN